mmetsp:Transcript_25974/g.69247  ORF Transcript_25974/g.69247 Transcript_25974/m.69247 type:complete len:297 (-) Transcript_25974:370-1260(-)
MRLRCTAPLLCTLSAINANASTMPPSHLDRERVAAVRCAAPARNACTAHKLLRTPAAPPPTPERSRELRPRLVEQDRFCWASLGLLRRLEWVADDRTGGLGSGLGGLEFLVQRILLVGGELVERALVARLGGLGRVEGRGRDGLALVLLGSPLGDARLLGEDCRRRDALLVVEEVERVRDGSERRSPRDRLVVELALRVLVLPRHVVRVDRVHVLGAAPFARLALLPLLHGRPKRNARCREAIAVLRRVGQHLPQLMHDLGWLLLLGQHVKVRHVLKLFADTAKVVAQPRALLVRV